jgi:hypothetical protein
VVVHFELELLLDYLHLRLPNLNYTEDSSQVLDLELLHVVPNYEEINNFYHLILTVQVQLQLIQNQKKLDRVRRR